MEIDPDLLIEMFKRMFRKLGKKDQLELLLELVKIAEVEE